MAGSAALLEVLVKGNARQSEMTSLERKAWWDFQWKSKRDLFLSMAGGATFGWFAGQKFNLARRLIVSAGASYVFTYELVADSIVSRHTNRILSMNGTWMQQEMAKSLLKRNHYDPKVMIMLSKYFYAEKVYDDSSDEPKLYWRRRNVFQESNPNFEASPDDDEHAPQNPDIEKPDQTRGTTPSQKPVSSLRQKPTNNNAVEVMENPFECIFGTIGEAEEMHSSSVPVTGRPNTLPKKHSHGSRRHRRHRKHHHEASEAA